MIPFTVGFLTGFATLWSVALLYRHYVEPETTATAERIREVMALREQIARKLGYTEGMIDAARSFAGREGNTHDEQRGPDSVLRDHYDLYGPSS